jgi:hypothetical protein
LAGITVFLDLKSANCVHSQITSLLKIWPETSQGLQAGLLQDLVGAYPGPESLDNIARPETAAAVQIRIKANAFDPPLHYAAHAALRQPRTLNVVAPSDLAEDVPTKD